MRVGSLFTGVGGFDLGFERAGMSIAWNSEINRNASKVLADRWPDVPNLGNITAIESVPTVDLICGGFPCQDVSQANTTRRGLGGARSGLFWDFARIVALAKPEWFVIENVRGLLTSNHGQDFKTVLDSMAAVGYQDISWRLLNSRGFGVPQNRRRLFVVGRRGDGDSSRRVLDDSEVLGPDSGPGFTVREFPPGPPEGVSATYRKSRRAANKTDYETWVSDGRANCLNLADGRIARATHLVITDKGPRILTPIEHERLQGFPDDWTSVIPKSGSREKLMGNAVTVPVAEYLGRRISHLHNT